MRKSGLMPPLMDGTALRGEQCFDINEAGANITLPAVSDKMLTLLTTCKPAKHNVAPGQNTCRPNEGE